MQNDYYYVICGIGYLPNKFETEAAADALAKVFYYCGEDYKILKGEAAFRKAYLAEYEKFSGKNSSDVKAIKNDRKWRRFMENFRLHIG